MGRKGYMSFRLNEQRTKWIRELQDRLYTDDRSQVIHLALMALANKLTKVTVEYKLVMMDLDGTLTPWRENSGSEFKREFLPGVREKCKELKQRGVTLGIVTNQRIPREDLQEHLDWVKEKLQIDCVWWTDDTSWLKPDPYMLRRMIDGLRLYPKECLMVGDDLSDSLAALRAGVDFEWAGKYFRKGENNGQV